MTIYNGGTAKTEIVFNGASMEKVYANGVLVHTRSTHTLVAADLSGFSGPGAVGYLVAGSLTPNTFARNNGGTATVIQFYIGNTGSTGNGTFGPALRFVMDGGTWSTLSITGTFTTGTHTQSYTPSDTKYFFEGQTELYNDGGKGTFVAGNTYLLNWT